MGWNNETYSETYFKRVINTEEGAIFLVAEEGEEIYFHGHGEDVDGEIIEYRWRSSIDGLLNEQQDFSTSQLSAGIHTIYFKVKDQNNIWSDEDYEFLTIDSTGSIPPSGEFGISIPLWVIIAAIFSIIALVIVLKLARRPKINE